MYDFDLIRRVLIQHARSLGRDYFEPCVVRAVIRSLMDGTEHHLKQVVLTELNKNKERTAQNRRKDLLTGFCKNNEMVKILAETSGISAPSIRNCIHLGHSIDDDCWGKLLDGFDEAKRIYGERDD